MDAPTSFHPLEIIPYFRRFPRSGARDFLYTVIWSTGFGLIFYALGAINDGRLQTLEAFGTYLLISNVIGFSIHGLFIAGERTGVEEAARRAGYIAKVAYYSIVPMIGVSIGFSAVSAITGLSFGGWLTRPAALISMMVTSIIISTILSIIFFWRERSARAEAEAARERERRERIERESLVANLRALQAQIEPHFLFNTLANVTSLIDPDPAKARRMLESFIRFLRASLAATRQDSTTLGAEGELIASYLEVLQVRMEGRLRYAVDIPPDLASYALPAMLLQPLVENAIRHGLEPKVEGGEVTMRARRNGDRVVVEVADSGVGFAPTTRGGVGLTNLRERLRLLFGERAVLEISDVPGSGARVLVSLPA